MGPSAWDRQRTVPYSQLANNHDGLVPRPLSVITVSSSVLAETIERNDLELESLEKTGHVNAPYWARARANSKYFSFRLEVYLLLLFTIEYVRYNCLYAGFCCWPLYVSGLTAFVSLHRRLLLSRNYILVINARDKKYDAYDNGRKCTLSAAAETFSVNWC